MSALALAGCASGQAAAGDPDGHVVELPPDAEVEADSPGVGRADAEPGAPDAAPKPDASPGLPDAMPPPPDASPPDAMLPPPPDATPAPDAPPGTPDASPPDAAVCTNMYLDVLVNGNFDGAPPWTESSSGGYPIQGAPPTGVTAQSAPSVAWLGGYDDGDDQLYQTVTIPADAMSIHLKGYRIIGTDEVGGMYDFLYVKLRTTGGADLVTLATYSNADAVGAWTALDLTVPTTYAGQTVQVFVQATTDFSLPTGFLLDSMVLEVLVCR